MNDEPKLRSVPGVLTGTDVLERWPQAVAVITGLTVTASVFYNWAYFAVVAPSALQLLTISDHVSGALQWLPASVLGFALNYVIDTALWHKSKPRGTHRRKVPAIFGVVPLAALALGMYLFAGTSDWWGVTAAATLLLIFFAVLVGRPIWGQHIALLLILGGGLVLVSLGEGNRMALADFTRTTANATLVLKDGPRIDHAVLLRQIEKGVLLRNLEDNRVVFVPWEAVTKLTTSADQIDPHFRICVFFKVFCSRTDPISAPPS